MSIVHAKFEDGVFKPVGRVELPEHSDVEFEPRLISKQPDPAAVALVFEVMSERYDSGETDVAARHDEHQP